MALSRVLTASLPALGSACALLAAMPAHASGGVELPEPSSLFLLGIGVAGVVLGRKLSSKSGD